MIHSLGDIWTSILKVLPIVLRKSNQKPESVLACLFFKWQAIKIF